jgi:hypothetical protein
VLRNALRGDTSAPLLAFAAFALTRDTAQPGCSTTRVSRFKELDHCPQKGKSDAVCRTSQRGRGADSSFVSTSEITMSEVQWASKSFQGILQRGHA